MNCDLPLRKRREIARAVLEGIHGFQYFWPERTEVYDALDSIVEANDSRLVMLSGHAGVGISSILEGFASKYNDRVIFVRPRIYSERLNMIGQVLHAVFPFSEFGTYSRVPEILIHLRKAARNIIILDDLDVISNQNNLHEVVFAQLSQLAGFPGHFIIIMSTRNKKLLRDYFSIKQRPATLLTVSGIIPASTKKDVIESFFEWCNQKYGTDVHSSCMACLGEQESASPIDRIVFDCESLYCAELLRVLSRVEGEMRHYKEKVNLSISYELVCRIRHAAAHCAFY